jgi:hypothetical protein
MTLLPAAGRQGSAMAEEFENYEARVEEARKAVERWEAEGGAQEQGHPAERAPDASPESERTTPSGEPDEATHDRGAATGR